MQEMEYIGLNWDSRIKKKRIGFYIDHSVSALLKCLVKQTFQLLGPYCFLFLKDFLLLVQ